MDDRLRLAFGLTDIVRRLACDEIRRSNPDATDVEFRRLMALRFLEPELAKAVIAHMDRLSMERTAGEERVRDLLDRAVTEAGEI